MDGPRLDQLKFPDETKVGLALLMVFMAFDVTQSITFGGWRLAPMLGFTQNTTVAGWLQLVMLLALVVSYGLWRQHQVLAKLGLRELSSADAGLADDADYLARHVAAGRGRFFVTSNFNDCNAFCLPAGKGSWIVLGAGLRVQFRKQRERVRAVLAHECAHLASGDVGYVVVGWYVFCAYTVLAASNLIVEQSAFWLRVPEVLSAFEDSGGLWGLIRFNAHRLFAAGFSVVPSIVGLWFVQRHFIQLREFRADERAAQSGLRSALIEVIRGLRSTAGTAWRRILTLHPSADQRIDRLASQTPWASLDTFFLGAMAFLVTRIDDLVPTRGAPNQLPSVDSPEEMMEAVLGMLAAGGAPLIGRLIFDLALGLLTLLHVHRVAVTQTALGVRWPSRLALLWPACIATFVGTFLGSATTWGQFARLADESLAWTTANALDYALSHAALATSSTWVFSMAIVVVASFPLRRAPGNWLAQTIWIVGSTLLASALIQAVMGMVGTVIVFLVDALPSTEVAGLPYSTRSSMPGDPGSLQLALILLALAWLLRLPRRLARSNSTAATVDPVWYAKS